ncbi:MAG TPA: FAD-binding oxidoreductase [Solirubrobacteraceae bacterium]|nr:FAD-binding oxidoreductase [Solirubrobacteraceae bacterium]
MESLVLRPEDIEQAQATLAAQSRSADAVRGVIPRGMGRSYGDAAQLAGGHVIDVTGMREFSLDGARGTVTAQAGVTLGELLGSLVPAGWMLPVVPGTQHVSVGGAIASDIHGKNHSTDGSFGHHVEALGLLTASGELLELVPGAPDGLFEATVGGMGLTGLIAWARIALKTVRSAMMTVDSDRVAHIDDALAVLASPAGGTYRVAWLDLVASRVGRGIVTRAEHIPDPGLAVASDGPRTVADGERATVATKFTVPARWPAGLLRASTIGPLNELRYRSVPRRKRGKLESIGTHLFPLDALNAWPRLYGPEGFLQYQLVVPYGHEDVIHSAIGGLRRRRVPCYLCVLKDMGEAGGAPLSFPISGWTLTLDIPWSAAGLRPLLDEFDCLVAEAGGRVYLSKDARMRPDALAAMYPELDRWRAARDRVDPERRWRSDLALRTGLVESVSG